MPRQRTKIRLAAGLDRTGRSQRSLTAAATSWVKDDGVLSVSVLETATVWNRSNTFFSWLIVYVYEGVQNFSEKGLFVDA